jgi:hypothetical protein
MNRIQKESRPQQSWCTWLLLILSLTVSLRGQSQPVRDSIPGHPVSTGWADEAVTAGIITAPAVLGLMFVSGLVNDWNAGYAGIPASAMILIGPPVIYAGGRSVHIAKESFSARAKLGWTLYALSIIPTSLALYSFTTDWGATVPLTLASGILGSASIVAMTSYAFSRSREAENSGTSAEGGWSIGFMPLSGGALASVSYRF